MQESLETKVGISNEKSEMDGLISNFHSLYQIPKRVIFSVDNSLDRPDLMFLTKKRKSSEEFERPHKNVEKIFAHCNYNKFVHCNHRECVRAKVKCRVRATMLHDYLKKSKVLTDIGCSVMDFAQQDHYCFGVKLPLRSVVPIVSCSVPFDVCFHQLEQEDYKPATTLECTLIGVDYEPIYIGWLGYSNVRKFSIDSEVEAELLRIASTK